MTLSLSTFLRPAAFVSMLMLLAPAMAHGQMSASATQNVTITVSEIAMLRIEGAAAPAFTVTAPTTAGGAPVISTDTADRYLQFTSIVDENQSRKIQVKHDGDIHDGLTLNLLLAAAVGSARQGETGTRESETLALTSADQDAITGVESGYTGTGASDGWKLNYALVVTGADASATSTSIAALFKKGPTAVTITYTLTAGS
jgi:hypothetical protein